MNNFEWKKTKQFSVMQLLLAFALPSAFAFTGFRVVLPQLVESGVPVLIAWPSIASVMLAIFVILGILLNRGEAKKLNIPVSSRMCMKRLSVKQWFLYVGVLILGLILAMAAAKLIVPFMKITGMKIPDYMPFFLNPAIDPMKTNPSILSPNIVLKGNFILLLLIGVTLLLNILAEELYFRAWIMPKMIKYGALGWILNGILFGLYHSYQLWLLPTILVVSLFTAFVVYKSKSIWPAFAVHLIGNFLLSILGVLMLILG